MITRICWFSFQKNTAQSICILGGGAKLGEKRFSSHPLHHPLEPWKWDEMKRSKAVLVGGNEAEKSVHYLHCNGNSKCPQEVSRSQQ